MPRLTSISTHNSRAYLLGHMAGVGDNFLVDLSRDPLDLSASAWGLTWTLSNALGPLLVSGLVSGVMRVANSPSREGWGVGVIGSFPSGVVFVSDEADGLLSLATNIITFCWSCPYTKEASSSNLDQFAILTSPDHKVVAVHGLHRLKQTKQRKR